MNDGRKMHDIIVQGRLGIHDIEPHASPPVVLLINIGHSTGGFPKKRVMSFITYPLFDY